MLYVNLPPLFRVTQTVLGYVGIAIPNTCKFTWWIYCGGSRLRKFFHDQLWAINICSLFLQRPEDWGAGCYKEGCNKRGIPGWMNSASPCVHCCFLGGGRLVWECAGALCPSSSSLLKTGQQLPPCKPPNRWKPPLSGLSCTANTWAKGKVKKKLLGAFF